MVEPWLLPIVRAGVETLDPNNTTHVCWVLGLIDQLGPKPAHVRSEAGLRRSRTDLAREAIRWCPGTERLAKWLARAVAKHGVVNLPAYLRSAIKSGDPGTLLESSQRNEVGCATETWSDFTPQTEKDLRGPYATEIAQMTAATAAVTGCTENEQVRAKLRAELRRYVDQHRRAAARAVLLKLVGGDRSDVAIQRATDGILTLAEGKRLLEAG